MGTFKLVLLSLACSAVLSSCHKMGPVNQVRAEGKYKGTTKATTSSWQQGVWVTTDTTYDMEVTVHFPQGGDVLISPYGMLQYQGKKTYTSLENGRVDAVFDPRDKTVKILYFAQTIGLGGSSFSTQFIGEKQ